MPGINVTPQVFEPETQNPDLSELQNQLDNLVRLRSLYDHDTHDITVPTKCRICGFSGDPKALNYESVCYWCHIEGKDDAPGG